MIYFDNAATSFPKPAATREALAAVFTRYGANPGRGGYEMAMETSQMVYRARERLIEFLGKEDASGVVFTQNCTGAINLGLKGVLRPGQHAVLSSMEHNSVLRPLERMKQDGFIAYDIAHVDINDPQKTVENFRALMRPNTRLVACIHGSNVFGTVQPVEELCALAHEQGALFLLDAAQTAGVLPIDLNRLPADIVALALHKGLYAPTALGALVVNGDMLLDTILEGGTGSLSLESDMPDFLPDRLEAGTVNTTGIAGFLGGLSFVKKRGVEKLHTQEMAVIRRLCAGLKKIPGVVLYNEPRLPVLSFCITGMTGEAVAARLGERGFALRGGLHCSPLAHRTMGTLEGGTARIGVGAFNTLPQAEALLQAVARLTKEQEKG